MLEVYGRLHGAVLDGVVDQVEQGLADRVRVRLDHDRPADSRILAEDLDRGQKEGQHENGVEEQAE